MGRLIDRLLGRQNAATKARKHVPNLPFEPKKAKRAGGSWWSLARRGKKSKPRRTPTTHRSYPGCHSCSDREFFKKCDLCKRRTCAVCDSAKHNKRTPDGRVFCDVTPTLKKKAA